MSVETADLLYEIERILTKVIHQKNPLLYLDGVVSIDDGVDHTTNEPYIILVMDDNQKFILKIEEY